MISCVLLWLLQTLLLYLRTEVRFFSDLELTDTDYSSIDLARPQLHPPFSLHTHYTGKSFDCMEKYHTTRKCKKKKAFGEMASGNISIVFLNI